MAVRIPLYMTIDWDCLRMAFRILMCMTFDRISLRLTVCEGAARTVVCFAFMDAHFYIYAMFGTRMGVCLQ